MSENELKCLCCGGFYEKEISRLTQELNDANEIKEAHYQSFQKWKKDYFKELGVMRKENQRYRVALERYRGQLASTDDGTLRMIAYETLEALEGTGDA